MSYAWHIFTLYAPDRYSPATGASFNRPVGSSSQQRTNLTRVIRTIDSMPGYRQAYLAGSPLACPSDPAFVPGIVHVSMYSMTDGRFASAMVNAQRRCLSVQILMNNHLDSSNDPAWRTLESTFGSSVFTSSGVARRSFAHRCHYGCRGGGVLHTKMYLFNSTTPRASANQIRSTVLFGSSNMTGNASKVQWNDLYGVRNDRSGLFGQFSHMFDLLKRDGSYHRNATLPAAGPYRATFWPQPYRSADAYLRALQSISCTGATGGAGINGRTVVNVNMHAWFGTRGTALANKVRSLYNHGCYVRVLYSFMSYGVFSTLHKGTGSRMSVRRTCFSHNGRTAYVYSHFKNIAVSGNMGGNRSARVVYTGSNNFTNEGLNFDEVTVRIASASAYRSYVNQFAYLRNRLSSATYANFSEPTGGGRAPARTKQAQLGTGTNGVAAAQGAPQGTPTITSPAVRMTDSGDPQALD